MTLTKTQLEGISQNLVNLYNNLEREMLINIAKRLSSKKELLKTDPEAWMMHQLEQLGMLDKQNLTTIKKAAGLTSNELNAIMYAVGVQGLEQTDNALKKAVKFGAGLVIPSPITESPIILNILRAFQRQARDVLNLVNQTMLINAKQVYTDILNRSVLNVVSGAQTHDQALRKAIAEMAENGIPALIDKGGKKWGVEGYVRTVLVSTSKNTMHAAQDARFEEFGVDYIEVTSHMGARPKCAPYQGKIFQLKGNDKYPNLYTQTSYGQPDGLFGINCGHRKFPFIPGVSVQRYFPYPKEENDKNYKESQVQRAHERAIRKAKTQYEMHKAAGDEEGMKDASALIKKRQSNMRDFIEATGRTRRRHREQIHTNKVLPTNYKRTDEIEKFIPKDPVAKKKTKTDIETPKEEMKPTPVEIPVEEVKTETPKTIDMNAIKVGDIVEYEDVTTGKIKSAKVTKNANGFAIHTDGDILFTGEIIKHIPVDNPEPIPKPPKPIIPKPEKGNDDLIINGRRIRSLDSFKRIEGSDHIDVKFDKEIFDKMRKDNLEDKKIVTKYTSNYYSIMNKHLRMDKTDEYVQREVDHLKKVLSTYAHEMNDDVMLFRRFDSGALPHIFGNDISKALDEAMVVRDDKQEYEVKAKELLIGGLIRDKGFISSTYKQGAFGSYSDVELEIYVPKGYKGGMFVESVSDFSSEKEYLFNAGTDFEIIEIEFKGRQITFKVMPTNL